MHTARGVGTSKEIGSGGPYSQSHYFWQSVSSNGGCFSQDICTLNEDVLRGSNMGMESGSTPADHIRVHTADGVTFMSKDKWPNLFVGEKNITQDGEG